MLNENLGGQNFTLKSIGLRNTKGMNRWVWKYSFHVLTKCAQW
jgi:hypothetical protein